MAGHVVVRKLEKQPPSQLLQDGVKLWKFEDGDSAAKHLTFKIDKDGFFIHATGDNSSQSATVWDLDFVSDVRPCRLLAKDARVSTAFKATLDGSEINEEHCVVMVHRDDGLTKLSRIYLMSEKKEIAEEFQICVNRLAHHLLSFNASVATSIRKHYVRLCLEADGLGQLPVKKIQKLMMVPRASKDDVVSYFESAKTAVKQLKDGTSYVKVSEFTFDIYLNLVDSLVQNRGPDLDVLKSSANIKARKQYISVKEFMEFLNTQQRDPRLNTILYPYVNTEQAKGLMMKYGQDSDRLTMKSLLIYLMNDENSVLDPSVFDQYQDMRKPFNHYFINSSHNTYLNGHQLRSESLAEMYAQVLLTGCRCVELDCWPSGDNEEILITHGNTLCTKITFKEVVEAINEYAFVSSDYPVILSIENHCNRYPRLITRMAEIFKDVFGDKLLSQPFEDFPLEPGRPLPSPEKLKGKILIKDKVRSAKGGGTVDATLPRGATLQGIPEIEVETTVTEVEETKPDEKTSVEKKEPEVKEEPPKAKVPPPLLSRPTLNKGMTILEEPITQEEEKEAKALSKKEPTSPTKTPSIEVEDETKQQKKDQKPMQKTQSVDSTGSGGGEKEEKLKYESGEASASGPLNQLLNYCTAMSFQSFEACEELNCSYIMSSFHEEKGLNFIKSKPKDFVRYNLKQNSRVYPAGGRIASSNYMPQIFWNVGCQMVALNFQTSDMPMQVNYAKYEVNGGTGYILKPSVLRADKGFNPFIQRKLQDIVPARLSIKVISGMFITKKKTNLTVELEMYGLPADLVRRQFTKKKSPAPHPFWNEDYFVFRRVLLPELALLRLAVLDDDHILVGQRILPVELLRAGFRHISLRDKHNYPLGMANLFVHIKIEDYVPDEYEEFAAALENPMKFVSRAVELMTMGTKEGEGEEFPDSGTDDVKKPDNGNQSSANGAPAPKRASVPAVKTFVSEDKPERKGSAAPPELETAVSTLKPPGRLSAGSMDTLGLKSKTLPNSSSFGGDTSFTSLREASKRDSITALSHDHQKIIEHQEYLKTLKAYSKSRAKLDKKHEEDLKKLKGKQEKEIKKQAKAASAKVTELEESHKEALSKLQQSQVKEKREFDRQSKIEQHEKQRSLLELFHKTQQKELEKRHTDDKNKVKSEMTQELKNMKKDASNSKNRDYLRGIETELFRIGMQTRSEMDTLHKKEEKYFKDSCDEAVKRMKEEHEKEIEELSNPAETTNGEN